MGNYSPSQVFSNKDALATGNPAKKILGADLDTELNLIASSTGTKVDTYSGASSLASPVAADSLSIYDSVAAQYKRLTVGNARLALDSFAGTGVILINNASPVVAGFGGSSVYNSMAAFGNVLEYADVANLATAWKITPGASNLGNWILGAVVNLTHNTAFPASTIIQLAITRFNSSNVAQSRNVVDQQQDVAGNTLAVMSSMIVVPISSSTDYFSVETLMSTAGNYNVNSCTFYGWRLN